MASEEQVKVLLERFGKLVHKELWNRGYWLPEQVICEAVIRANERMRQGTSSRPQAAVAPVAQSPSSAMEALNDVAARTVIGPETSQTEEPPPVPPEKPKPVPTEEPQEALPEAEPPEELPEKPKPFTWDRFFAWCEAWRAKHRWDNYPQLGPASSFEDFLAFSQSFPRRGCAQEKWTFRLLALAWLFERGENELRSNSEILQAEPYRDFGYIQFPLHPNEFREGLAELGASLRRAPNEGDWQYVRTILYYSGWMYDRLARRVAELISTSGWQALLGETSRLREVLEERVRRYQGQDDVGVLDDVVDFFRQVAERYLRAKGLTVEDIREANPGIKPVLAERILQTLLDAEKAQRRGRGRRKAVEADEENWTLPEIALDAQGRAILSFPEQGSFASEVDRAVFRIDRLGQERAALIAYRRQADGRFQLVAGGERQVLLLDQDRRPITSVRRILGGQERQRLGEEEVLPEAVLGRDFLLLKVTHEEGNAWQLDEVIGDPNDDEETGVALHAGETYQVVPLRQSVQAIQVVTEGGDGQEVEQQLADNKRFSPGEDWQQVSIAGVTYPVATQMDDYLRQRVPHVKRRGYTVYNGACSPFQWVKCEQEGVTAVYRLPETGEEYVFTAADLQAGVPQEWHWKRGTLELRFPGGRVLQRRVVFVGDVPSEIECEAAYDTKVEAEVEIAGQPVLVTIPPFKDKVTVDFRGCTVHLAVPNRLGVAFELASGEAVAYVAPGDAYEAPQTEIARKDLESLHIRRLGKGTRHYFMTRGKTAIAHLEKRRFLYKEIPNQGLFEAEASPYYGIAFCEPEGHVKRNALFPFKVYDPEKSEIEAGRRIKVERDGCDLILTYWCSFLDRSRTKGLAFYPIHRQDERPKILWDEAEKVEEQCFVHPTTNRYQECLRVRNFYTPDKDWGFGRLCFVVSKVEYTNGNWSPQVISSGFLAKAPQELRTEIDNPNDEANELRKAFVGGTNCCEDGETLEKIMTSKDPETHKTPKYVLDFLERMRKAVAELGVFEYLNSYWNRLVPEEGARPTGFAFRCGAHVHKHLVEKTFQPYRKLWNKELISDRDWEELTGRPRQITAASAAQAWEILHYQEHRNVQRIVQQLSNLPFRLQTAFVKWIRSRSQNEDGAVPLHGQTGADTFFCEQRVLFDDPRELVYHREAQGNRGWPHDRHITSINPHWIDGADPLPGERVLEVLRAFGEELRQWRANPTLANAQPLRKGLVLLDEIDQTIQELWKGQAALAENPDQRGPGPISLIGVVCFFAQTAVPHGQNA